MGDLEKTIKIIFEGVDELSQPISKISDKLGDLSSSVDDVVSPMAAAAEGVLKLDAALAAMVVTGLAYAIKSGGEFTSQLNEINTMAGISSDRLGEFGQDIIDYAKDSTQSYEAVNAAIYQALSLGISYEDSLKSLSTAEKLAVGGKAELVSATELLLGTMNAYGAGVQDAERFSDAFFTIVRNGKTTIPELASSLADVTGVASSGGVSIEVLGSALAALTATGSPTSQAITQIKAVIESLIRVTPDAAKEAERLGIQFGYQALAANGLDGVMRDVWKATDGNVESMAKLFPQSEALQGALKLGADSAGIFAKSLVDMNAKTGVTAAAYAAMVDNIEYDNQRLLNNVKAIFISIGLSLEGERHNVTKAATNLFKAIGDAVDAGVFDEFFEMVKQLGVGMTAQMNGIAINLKESLGNVNFDALITSLKGLSNEFGELFSEIDLSTPEGLTAAIQLAVDSIASLMDVTSGIVKALAPISDGVVTLANTFNSLSSPAKEAIGQILGFSLVLSGLAVALAVGGAVLGGLSNLALFFSAAGSLAVGITGTAASLTALMAHPAFAAATAGALGWAVGDQLRGIFPSIDEYVQKMIQAADSVLNFSGQAGNVDLGFTKDNLDGVAGAAENVALHLYEIPERKTVIVDLDDSGSDFIGLAEDVDQANSKIDETKAKIDALPSSKMLEIQLQGDIDIQLASIKAQAETMQAGFEWTAKVNIEQIQAEAKKMQAAFESVTATIASSADVFSTGLEGVESENHQARSASLDLLRQEVKIREEAFELQKKLTESQIAHTDAKTKALASGDAAITIDSSGLEPALEMIMWQIIEKVQIRANENASEFLLGL